jgi:hypothetical protein
MKHHLYPTLCYKRDVGHKKTRSLNRESLRAADLTNAVTRQRCGLFPNLWGCLHRMTVLAHIKGVALIRHLQRGDGEPALC